MMLPNFLIIGAAKAATTSLYRYLKSHPEVFMSTIKEVNFFAYSADGLGFPASWNKDRHHQFPATTLDDYSALFVGAEGYRAIGEASPLYLDSPLAPARIEATLPDVRLIVSLRNPVERLISDYKMRARCGFTVETFEEEFQPGKQIFELGFVAARLADYFDRFPREKIKVLLFDDITSDPATVMCDLYAFLGVDEGFVPDVTTRFNSSLGRSTKVPNSPIRRIARSLSDVWHRKHSPAAHSARLLSDVPWERHRQLIAATYRDDIRQLEQLIGRNLDGWLTTVDEAGDD